MKFRSDCIIMYLLQEECDLMDTLYLLLLSALLSPVWTQNTWSD